MKHNLLHESTVVAVASRGAERAIHAYVNMLTAHHNARVSMLSLPAEDPFVTPWGPCQGDSGNGAIRTAIREVSKAQRISLIVSEWLPRPTDMQDVLKLAHELKVPAVFIRNPQTRPGGRVIIATDGGPNVLQQMWVARETACAWSRPVHLLRIVHPALSPDTSPLLPDPAAALDACSCRLLHMEPKVEIKRATDIVGAITDSIRDGDLLVLGAPSTLRLTADFAGSIPHVVANRVSGPMILLSTPSDDDISLRRLFWGRLIKTDMRTYHKKHVLAAMITNLIHHNQLPLSSQNDILDRVLRREATMSTAVDCETAFPHVTLGGFFGVAATMAICPDGILFDSPDGRPTRFIYLLVTPDGFYEQYLATLAKIARRMINPEVRQALLACHSPAQALDVLEPRAGNVGRTESGLPPYPRGAACETDELAGQLPRETLQR
ncbi:MAG: PTS sugar transporter subunit IIA [Planctomycetia bacterium]|nr:PTS sugar transporter subunit IIA [Planctomycetia bacterium]